METTKEKNNKGPPQTTSSVLDQLKLHFFHPGGFGKHLTELGFDLSKLKQVNKETIQEGEKILIKIAEDLNKLETQENLRNHQDEYNQITKMSDEFYKLIPHLPTTQQSLLDKKINVDSKFSLVKTLNYVLEAFDTINKTQASNDFLGKLYDNLKFNIIPLEKNMKDYDIIERYGNDNSRLANSILYPVVKSIFKCTSKEVNNSNNLEASEKILLWYGDRICCYAGILSEGFKYKDRIMGAGESFFSFSESVIKAMSSCYLDRGDKEAFLFLCEVDLGKKFEFLSYEAMNNVQDKELKSSKIVGKMSSSKEKHEILEDKLIVPLGKLEAVNQEALILYNDFLIYNSDQISLRYIVKFEIKSE